MNIFTDKLLKLCFKSLHSDFPLLMDNAYDSYHLIN